MRTPRLRRRPECEVLESRRCPSITIPPAPANYPGPEQPIERLDALALNQHAAALAAVAAGQASNVVFLGDSITQWFQQGAGASVWNQKIAPLGAADLGVAGDTTQNLLWRIENGELAGQPKVAVLLIGTNNLGIGLSVSETLAGIEADMAAIHQVSPHTQILLNGVFPRGDATDTVRLEGEQVNAALASLAPSLGVIYSDPGQAMVTPSGSIAPSFQFDLTHPDAQGYQLWANGVIGSIEAMLAATPPVATPTPAAPTAVALIVGPVSIATTPTATTTASTAKPASAPVSSTTGASATVLVTPASVTTTAPAQAPTANSPAVNVLSTETSGSAKPQRVAQSSASYQPLALDGLSD